MKRSPKRSLEVATAESTFQDASGGAGVDVGRAQGRDRRGQQLVVVNGWPLDSGWGSRRHRQFDEGAATEI
jgi:hypothetical protein